ncbi:GspH/FimT family pseudopilin [Aromatoleum sp.]|uniref:GspH/FimT family pseudopilin n=1 Tax=Aromatoleum sp. TaxID=2307007 RepID=UPI002FC6C70F
MAARAISGALTARAPGFSLVELMVTVAVIGILAGVGYPSFQELLASQRVRVATSALYDSLLIARSEALKRNIATQFVTDNLAEGWSIDAGGRDVHSQGPLTALTFEPHAPAIQYGPTGRLAVGAATEIEVTAAGTSAVRCIRLDTTGRPRLAEGSC